MKIKILKYVLNTFKIFLILFLGCILFLSWHLYRGGINFPFITYLAETALNPNPSEYTVTIDKADFSFIRQAVPIAINVHNASIRDKSNRNVANVKELSISLSAKGLLQGKIAPSSIIVYGPSLGMFISKGGNVGIGFFRNKSEKKVSEEPKINKVAMEVSSQNSMDSENSIPKKVNVETANSEVSTSTPSVTSDMETTGVDFSEFDNIDVIDPLLSAKKGAFGVYSYLESLIIKRGRLLCKDEITDTLWVFNNVNIDIKKRDDKFTLKGEGYLLQRHFAQSHFSIKAENTLDKMVLNADIDNFILPKTLSHIVLADMQVSAPLKGKIEASFNLDKSLGLKSISERLEQMDFSFASKKGSLIMPKNIGTLYDIKSFLIEGYVQSGFKGITVSQISASTVSGGLAWGTAEITGLYEAMMSGSLDALNMDFHVQAKGITIPKLKEYWPKMLGATTHEWVRENIFSGDIISSSFNLLFKSDKNGELTAAKTDGEVNIKNASVRYIDSLPIVKDISGTVFLTKDDVRIKIDSGQSEGLELYDSELYFYDIWEPQEQARLFLKVRGDLQSALQLLDKKPFDFISSLGLNPEGMKGDTDTAIKIEFPLRRDLTVDKVKVDSISSIKSADVILSKDYSLKNTDMSLTVNNLELTAKGTGLFGNTKTDFLWNEVFSTKKAGSYYKIDMILDEQARKDMALDIYPFDNNSLTGLVKANIQVQRNTKGKEIIDVKADFTEAEFTNKLLSVNKPQGVRSEGLLRARREKAKFVSIPSFSFTADNNIAITGSITNIQDEAPLAISLDKLVMPGTDMKANITIAKDIITIKAEGSSFNAEPLFIFTEYVEKDDIPLKGDNPIKLGITASSDEVWVSEKGTLYDVELNLFYDVLGKKDGHLKAKTITGKDVALYIRPVEEGLSKIFLVSEDGGALLKALGYTSVIKGGNLKAFAYLNNKHELDGKISMTSFSIVNSPVLSKILQIASLTGILSAMHGEGLEFDKTLIPFTYKQSTWQIKDAIASGFSLGLTGEGYYREGIIDGEGSIVPAYTFNSFFGRIPLIGTFFTSEPEGGLIAFKYYVDGYLNSPTVVVNPLSALTPGMIRMLFNTNPAEEEIYEQETDIKNDIDSIEQEVVKND